ncbi:MAG: aldo/keto reductase [Anaerolineae bacterium]
MTDQEPRSEAPRLGDQLPRRRLGRSELNVPAFAMGGYPLGVEQPDEDEAIATVQYAVDQGIDYLDTSPMYGDSERRIGLALEGYDREKLVISTKTGSHPQRRGDYSYDGTMWSVENSLKLLKTDYLDLVLVHDVNVLHPEQLKPVLAPHGALDALEALKAQGVIRAIGLGQRDFEIHRQAIETDRFDVILTFNNYHPLDTSAADWLLPLAEAHDVGVLNGAVMAHGLLTGEDPDEIVARRAFAESVTRLLPAARKLYAFCRRWEVPMAAVLFQFSMRQPLIDCTLCGPKSRAEMAENLHAATMALPEELWAELAALDLPSIVEA